MRILRVHLRNLNSLRGDHWIDFTRPPLADHQLYAIVGPTGAGKTTILDAITLALYGQTERNKDENDRKDGSGTVLSYGEGECLAELDYEVKIDGRHERFRSAWYRQRAHKKPDGNLTPSRHSIARFLPDEPDEAKQWKPLATKKREVAAKTLEIVGLDYERFVRSVMLTQGDFARFLKSDVGNKAEILEKITGTAIYRDLSVAAFNRAKQATEAHQRAVAELATAPALADEDRARLDGQLVAQRTAATALREELAQLTAQLTKHERLRELTTKEAAAGQSVIRLEQTWSALATERERLALSDGLQALRSDLEAELRLEKEAGRLATELAGTEQQQKTAEQALAVASVAIQTARSRLEAYNDKLPAREEKLVVVAALEREITTLSRDVTLERKRQETIGASGRERRSKAKKTEQEVVALRSALAGLEPAQIRDRLLALEGSIPDVGTEVNTLARRIERRQLLDRRQAERGKADELASRLAGATKAAEDLAAALTVAETSLSDRRLLLNNLQVSASLAEHKHNLQEGEACPVCGATEHPALADFQPVTESAIRQAHLDVNKALDVETVARRQVKEAGQTVSALQREYDRVATVVAELTARLAATDGAEAVAPLAELREAHAAAQQRLAADTAEQGRLRQLQTNLPRLSALEADLTALRERLAELDAEAAAVNARLTDTQRVIAEKQARVKAEVGELTSEQCRERLRRKKEALVKALAETEKAEVDRKGQLATLSARLQDLSDRQRGQLASLAEVRARLAGALPEGLSATAARAALLSENDALHLRARQNETQIQLTTARALRQQLSEELSAAQAATAGLPTTESLEQGKRDKTHALSKSEQETGALELQTRQDDERIRAAADRRQELAGLRHEMDRWATMNRLIGAADGKKFRSYAQAITLQRLVDVGNDHLNTISPRYRMEYAAPAAGSSENLEIIIVDTYHDENKRTVATLSGGETFLISLALALGLSDLASGRHAIQSLFIDEGFGTLDGKTLDKAMTTLEQLREQGKTIGLISHVASLRERIQCQIRLEPVGDGFSRIDVV